MNAVQQTASAFVFPGQGSQTVGMLSALAETYSEVKATFAAASDVLDFDLWTLVSQGPRAELDSTRNTQPAMLAAGVAVWRVWCRETGARPDWMAGHSLGEYTALVCADALDFEDGIRLVAERGRLMQEAVAPGAGAMAAILGLDDETVVDLCTQAAADDVLAAVNFNAPGQVVIAGDAVAVERGVSLAKASGAKRAVPLPVSVPSHCTLMRPAAKRLSEHLGATEFRSPTIPIIHNVDVEPHSDPDAIRDILTRQLYSPVRWVESIRRMHQNGARTLVECGPGKVLSALSKRIVRECDALAVSDPPSLNKALEHFA